MMIRKLLITPGSLFALSAAVGPSVCIPRQPIPPWPDLRTFHLGSTSSRQKTISAREIF